MKPRLVFLFFLVLALMVALSATIVQARPLATASSYGGTYTGWPTTWTAISSLNDPDNLLANERIDFVGDTSDPGAYYAGNSEYLYFRVRVDDGTATEFSDSILILIDQGQNGALDYAFQWDSQSNDQTGHGLELGVPRDVGTTWATTRMNDRDANNAQKIAPPDFGLSNGDGYIRILNGQSTTNFGTTTFVDFAIKWSYLSTNSLLGKGQTWNIQLGSINNANDHNFIDYDVAGGQSPSGNLTFPGTVGFSPTAVTVDNLYSQNQVRGQTYGIVLAIVLLFICLGVAIRLGSRASRSR
jgi:hypothetical protein